MAISGEFGRNVRRTASVAIALLLAACTGTSDIFGVFEQDRNGTSGGAETAALPPPAPAAKPPVPAPPPRPSRAEPVSPKRLVGLTRDQVTQLIGQPNAVNDNPPATVWVYRTEGCTLDVMFYMDIGTRTFRALAYEVKPNGPNHLAEPECLGRIRAARNGH
jgi:hypothetical protein